MDDKKINETAERIKKEVADLIDVGKVQEIVSKNEIEFDYKETKYRVKKPTYKQKNEANQKRIVKYTELLRATDDKGKPLYIMEEDLINLYKQRGIDIKKLDVEYAVLDKQFKSYLLKLGEAIKNKKPEKELQIYKEEIEKIKIDINTITAKKAVMLDASIETQMLVYIYSYLSYLVAEKFVGEKWTKAYKTYEEFLDSDDMLVNIIVFYVSIIAKNDLGMF